MALVSATQGVGVDAGKEGDVAAGAEFCRLHIARMHRNTLATRAQGAGLDKNTVQPCGRACAEAGRGTGRGERDWCIGRQSSHRHGRR